MRSYRDDAEAIVWLRTLWQWSASPSQRSGNLGNWRCWKLDVPMTVRSRSTMPAAVAAAPVHGFNANFTNKNAIDWNRVGQGNRRFYLQRRGRQGEKEFAMSKEQQNKAIVARW